jgi:hypothetical protein
VEPACGHAPCGRAADAGLLRAAGGGLCAHNALKAGCTTRWWRAWWCGLAHLLANGQAADLLLFGSFLPGRAGLAQRAPARPGCATAYPPARSGSTAMTVLAGLLAWAAFAFWGHRWLIGVSPLGL